MNNNDERDYHLTEEEHHNEFYIPEDPERDYEEEHYNAHLLDDELDDEYIDYPNTGSDEIHLHLSVIVPKNTAPAEVAEALNQWIDEATLTGNIGYRWDKWIVGTILLGTL